MWISWIMTTTGMFVAVRPDNTVYTSPNGADWSLHIPEGAARNWLCYPSGKVLYAYCPDRGYVVPLLGRTFPPNSVGLHDFTRAVDDFVGERASAIMTARMTETRVRIGPKDPCY